MAGRYDLQMVPDPSSPTGFSPQYVYTPATPVERAQAQIGEIARGLGRQLGLTGRYIAEGTAGTVGIVTNSLAAMGAAATGDMRNFVPLQEQVSRGLTALGVPEPRGAVEQSVAGLSRAVAGAGGVAGAARAAIPVATGAVGRGTLTELAAMPGRQLAAGATGEGARQLAEAGGAGPIGQTLAAVGGGAIPFAGAPTTAASLVDDLSAAYRPGSVVRSGAGPVPPPPPAPPRRISPFDYAAYEAENPMPRPFETAPNLPPPRTYEEAVDQVQSLQAQLNEAYRDVGRSTSVQNPGVSGVRSLDRRAILERQLAAARTELERLRPPTPERVNPPGTSEAARAYLERLGMGRVAELGSTRPAAPEPLGPVKAEQSPPRALQQAQQAGYAGQAPGEAVEYLAATAKGLPMDGASRIQRARDLGFDTETVLYHGTATNFASFDPRKAGGVTKARSAKMGTWLTESPKTAEGYADVASGKPVQDLIDASYAAERAGQWDKANRLMAEAEALETAGTAGQIIMPLHVRGKLKTIDMGGVQYDPDDVNLTEIANTAKREGFAGVRLTNFSDEAGYGQYNPTTHVLIFDPANIRSIHAAFDPDQSGSANLLAGIGALAAPAAGLGAAGAMAAGTMQEPERRID